MHFKDFKVYKQKDQIKAIDIFERQILKKPISRSLLHERWSKWLDSKITAHLHKNTEKKAQFPFHSLGLLELAFSDKLFLHLLPITFRYSWLPATSCDLTQFCL